MPVRQGLGMRLTLGRILDNDLARRNGIPLDHNALWIESQQQLFGEQGDNAVRHTVLCLDTDLGQPLLVNQLGDIGSPDRQQTLQEIPVLVFLVKGSPLISRHDTHFMVTLGCFQPSRETTTQQRAMKKQ